jgi:TldD protein
VRELAETALGAAKRGGASYADIRIVRRRDRYIHVKNDNVEAVTQGSSRGFGIRALVDGAWGFSSSSEMTKEEAREVAAEAVKIAKASALVKGGDVRLAPEEAHMDSYRTNFARDPFTVPLEEQIQLLVEAQKLLGIDPVIKVRTATASFFHQVSSFASTEGAYIEQDILQSGAGIQATAIQAGEVEVRSYPASFGGDFRQAGWEFVEGLKLLENAPRVGRQALELLAAKKCPAGSSDLVLGTNQMALQVHESCGHPTELDRVLGMEASYAGTSFLTPEKRSGFPYGSEGVTIVADATVPGGLGTFGYDDEGVKAQRVELVRKGLFVGYQTSRETAPLFGERSSGAMRADGWDHIPLIRMTNINLEPGDWKLEELLQDTRSGLYMDTNKSWSIDDLRLNFQFGTEVAWQINDGELGEMYRYPTYTGITPEFWRTCDAVCSEREAHLWGIPNCGKGEPGQTARVGHRTAPARFRGVRVGVA